MARGAWSLAVGALVVALAGCAGRKRAGLSEPAIRIWAPAMLRWEGSTDRSVRFVLENGSSHPVTVASPDAHRAKVAVFGVDEDRPACGTDPADVPAGAAVSLAPGDQIAMRVDLSAACRSLGPGSYRMEVTYQPPRDGPGDTAAPRPWSGALVIGP